MNFTFNKLLFAFKCNRNNKLKFQKIIHVGNVWRRKFLSYTWSKKFSFFLRLKWSRRIDQFVKITWHRVSSISTECGVAEERKRTKLPLSRSISRVGNDWNKRLKHYFHAIRPNWSIVRVVMTQVNTVVVFVVGRIAQVWSEETGYKLNLFECKILIALEQTNVLYSFAI